MEKPQPHQQQQPPPHQQILKCPRCDSSNTKFCYYNNYSLSQPRHFCKACKRYWTRGGTLRNVPVGGGCRKNKRVKRAPSSSSTVAAATVEGVCANNSLNPNPNSSSQNPQIEISISSPHHHQISPFFFGSEMNNLNPFHGRFNSGYDLNGLGLGFSSTSTSGSCMLSNYSIFGSSLQQLHQNQNQSNKLMSMKDAHHQNYDGSGGALTAFEELQLSGNYNNNNSESAGICTSNTVKVELQQDNHQQNRFDWNNNQNNQIEQIGYSSLDPTLYWNPNTSSTTSVGSLWHDNPNSNIGSSLTSLI